MWNGESTILLVNFPDDKKYVLSSNPQGTTTMQNFLVPISTNSPNINAIVKKIIQPPPPPPPVSLHLTQITAPKISSRSMNVDTIKSRNANKMQNRLEQHQQHQQQQQHHQSQSQSQTLPSMNTAITMANSADHGMHTLNNVVLNNMATTHPFNGATTVKKEFTLFDATSSADSTMIPNDLLLSANAMDTLSPMPQSNCDDSCNSFDLFLSEAAQSHSDANKLQHHLHDKSLNMDIKKELSVVQNGPSSQNDVCPVDLKTFDDLELMELMGQQLDMDISSDISDDSCQPMVGIKHELNNDR